MVPATETLKTHCPDWEFADALALTLAWQLWPTLLCQLQDVHATENLKTHCPDGIIANVLARLTIAQLRTLWSTLLQLVRATDTQTSHRPHGKVADALASTHASTTVAHSPVNDSMYVPQRPETFPSPQWETHVLLFFAGRRCRCRGWHSVHLIEHHQWEHSCKCVHAHFQNFPSPQWDALLLCLPL